jgi:hypothetical protein
MNKLNETDEDGMQPEYDFSGGVRGKYAKRLANLKNPNSTTTIVLDPDVAQYFHDSTSVNAALRLLITVANERIQVPA